MDLLTECTAISEHGDALFARGCYEGAAASPGKAPAPDPDA
jgi:hypothetical protein